MFRRIPVKLFVFALAVIGLVLGWVEREPILRFSAHSWVVHDNLEPADAVVVLGGGINTRPFAAARLYKSNFANKILVASPKVYENGDFKIIPHDANVTRNLLIKLGVPSGAITFFGHDVSNTYEEARALAQWAEQNKPKRLIIPTEEFPSRRVRWIMRRQLGQAGVEVIIDAIPPLEYDIDHWWQYDIGLIEFQNEILKYLFYRIKYS